MDKLKIQVILGSTRPQRFGEQPAQWIFELTQKHESFEAELIDLRDWPLPFFDEPESPAMTDNRVNELGAKWAQKISEADGYIWVTPEYNHSYSAVLKNALDYVYKEWNHKPVAFVSYGAVGGARAVEHLRQVAVELKMAPLREAVYIVNFWSLLDENGKWRSEEFETNADKMLTELDWWTRVLKKGRES